MKIFLLFLNAVMFVTPFAELFANHSYALAAGLFVIAFLSAAALFFADRYRQNSGKEAYETRLKLIQSMTMVCAFISLYWPDDAYYNVSLFACLVFHCGLKKYTSQKK